ncbi:MAG: NAD-dependent epimerase/dehydratase family protein, partial [Clostridiales bacterium]
MKTILITGINGFLGNHLADYLSEDYHVIGLEKGRLGETDRKSKNFLIYDSLTNNLEQIFKKHEIWSIIHTATLYKKNEESLLNLIDTNIKLPIELFELAEKYYIELFINTDTFFNIP